MSIPKKVQLNPSVQPTVKTNYMGITATTTVTKLVGESPLRKELIVTNTSSAPLYLAFGALPSSTNYAVAVPAAGGVFFTDSTDRINGVWASAGGGQANITERF